MSLDFLEERKTQELLEELIGHTHACCKWLESLNTWCEQLDKALARTASGVSSVEIKTSTRGVDITTKVYAGSDVVGAGDAAMDEFIRVGREVEKRLTGQT